MKRARGKGSARGRRRDEEWESGFKEEKWEKSLKLNWEVGQFYKVEALDHSSYLSYFKTPFS